jgi:hypothetical protein
MVFAVVLEAVAVFPAGTKDVEGKAEFGVVIVDGNRAAGFTGFVSDDGEGEAQLTERGEGRVEVVIGDAVAAADDGGNAWWLGRCRSASWSRCASRGCRAMGCRENGFSREANASGGWSPRAWSLRERARGVLGRERRVPGFFVEDLGDEAVEIWDGDLNRLAVLVREPCRETDLEPA